MTNKIAYNKDYKPLYVPRTTPALIDVPEMPFVLLSGEGDPNGEAFARATEALYSFSYTVKMAYKREIAPVGYYDYTVFPLEGVWDLVDRTRPPTDKNNLKYTIMIRQPDFLTEALFHEFVEQAGRKKANPYLESLTFERWTEGLCCQMLHIGSYEDEPASFARMEQYCSSNGCSRAAKTHREIYLSDPRRTDKQKLKTVLRFAVSMD